MRMCSYRNTINFHSVIDLHLIMMWVEQDKSCPQWLCLDKKWPHKSYLEKPGLPRAFKAANDSLPNDIMDHGEALKLKAFSSQDLPFVSTFPQCEVGLSGFVISFVTRTDGKSPSKWWNSANRWWLTFKICETLHFFHDFRCKVIAQLPQASPGFGFEGDLS